VEHENLVRLLDFGFTADGRAFYAMELLEGETLDRRLARGEVLDWREAARIGVQAAAALAAAHAAGVVHRDIKPANLFLTSDGTLKLLDFGIAKVTRDLDEAARHGEALSVVGTPEYMAPEQARGGESDDRSDLYALGAVLYELVTGRLPFDAPSTVLLLHEKTTTKPEAPRVRAPQRGIPTMLDKTISRALEPSSDDRFQNAEDMREALDAALREPDEKRRRRRRIGLGVVGAMVIAIGAFGGVLGAKPEIRAQAAQAVQRLKGAPPAPVAAAPAEAPEGDEPAANQGDEAAPGETAEAPAAVEEPAEEAAAEPAAEPEKAAGEVAQAEPEKAEGEPAKAEPTPAEEKKTEEKKAAVDDEMFSAQPVKAGDQVEGALAKAAELMQSGKKVKAFNEYRKIGKKHRKDPRALKAWSETAAQMKGYGEALRVAKQWASLDKTIEPRMFLASMQRKVGKREDAIKTLSALLAERPGCQEARSMLKSLSPEARVAQR
jgi:serine/threonine-protein kinase